MPRPFGENAIRWCSHPVLHCALSRGYVASVILRALRIRNLWHLLQVYPIFRGRMSVKAIMAAILQDQMTMRGVHSLAPSDYEEIVKLLIEQLRELELNFAAREIADKRQP